jgi:glucose-1-phosphate thymidylyltransferase
MARATPPARESAMKVIIPLAGKGTRLRPHTHVTPKPMLKVAGRPVMDYVMDDVKALGDVEQVVYITGHLKEKVEHYAASAYGLPSVFVEQKVQDGTAGAVALAAPYVDQPVLIIFVDTIFDADLSVIHDSDADGIIWTKEVEDYQRFGVVVTDADGYMTRIVEKPKEPVSRNANIGLYYIRNWQLLFEGIAHVLQQPANKGEWYLTDAFQYMIDHGARIRVETVSGWYDAGQVDTYLDTNRTILEHGRARVPASLGAGATIVDPVYIEDGAVVEHSTVGPNVCLLAGTTVRGSTLSDTIVGAGTTITDCTLTRSLVGDQVVLEGVSGTVSVGDHATVQAAGGSAA